MTASEPPFPTPAQVAGDRRVALEPDAAKLRAAVREAFKGDLVGGTYTGHWPADIDFAAFYIVKDELADNWELEYDSNQTGGPGALIRIRPLAR